MGYLRHKYTRTYFLKKDPAGNPTIWGAEGVESFEKGGIRQADRDVLCGLDLRDKAVLDLGCGRGDAIKFAMDHGAASAVGVDFSEDANAIARGFLEQYGVSAQLHCDDALSFLQGYTAREKVERFDVVLMLDFVEHVPRCELTKILKLVHAILSPRAVAAINTPIFPVDNDVIANGLDPRARDTSDEFQETAGMHCNRYTRKSLRKYMATCGFVAISGHLFVRGFSIAGPLQGSPWAWWKAFKSGYPILLSSLWQRQRFERAFSWEEIRRRQRHPARRALGLTKRIGRALLRRVGCHRAEERSESVPQWVEVMDGPLRGYHLFLDLHSPAYWQREMMEGRYDSFMFEALDGCSDLEAATVWDVGAHVGYHSLAFAALVGPHGRVVAFEPNPYNAARLRKNLGKNPDLAGRVALMTWALSNIDGEASFVLSSGVDNGRSSGSHLDDAIVPEQSAEYEGFTRARVATVKADTLLREKRVPSPSIIKIDVEGAEQLVLEGAVELLSTESPVLLIEVHNITMMFHVQKLLLSLGYEMEILDAEHSSRSRCFVIATPMER